MSKKKWVLAILIIMGLGYLLISKVYPGIGTAIDNWLGPSITGFFDGIAIAITSSPTWQMYDIYFSMAFGIIVTSLLWWQGHNTYNKVRGVAVKSAAKETGFVYQTVPTAQPVSIPQQATVVQPQQVIPQPTPPVQEQPKQ